MSYLRGPLTRGQIKTLMDARRGAPAPRPPPAPSRRAAAEERGGAHRARGRPRRDAAPAATGAASARCCRPTCRSTSCPPVAARPPAARCSTSRCSSDAAQVRVADAKNKIDVSRDVAVLTPITDEAVPVDWEQAAAVGFTPAELTPAPEGDAGFAELPATGGQEEELRRLEQGLRGLAAPVAEDRAAADARRSRWSRSPTSRSATSGCACRRPPARIATERATPLRQKYAPKSRGAPGAPPPRRAGGGARERAGQAAGAPDRDLGRRHDPGRLPRPQVDQREHDRPRHHRRARRRSRAEGDAGRGPGQGDGGRGGRGHRRARRPVQGRGRRPRRAHRSADRAARDDRAQADAAEHRGAAGRAGLGARLARRDRPASPRPGSNSSPAVQPVWCIVVDTPCVRARSSVFLALAVSWPSSPPSLLPGPSPYPLPGGRGNSSAGSWCGRWMATRCGCGSRVGIEKVRYIGIDTPEVHHPTRGRGAGRARGHRDQPRARRRPAGAARARRAASRPLRAAPGLRLGHGAPTAWRSW